MKNIPFHSNYRNHHYQSEIIETEISDWDSNNHLPRHISTPQTKSHRGERDLGAIDYAPRVCPIDSNPNSDNLAVNILNYQLGDRAAQKKHVQNVCHSLKRRLLIAKSQDNKQLITVLKDEYNQLALECLID